MNESPYNEIASSLERKLDCPNCTTHSMEVRSIGNVEIDRCDQCYGTWYDSGELRTLIGPGFKRDQIMQNMQMTHSDRFCPVCTTKMTGLTYESNRFSLTIDHCLSCHGFFLDHGEREKMEILNRVITTHRTSSFRPIAVSAGFQPESTRNEVLQHYQTLDLEKGAGYEDISIPVYFFCLFSRLPVEVYNPCKRFPWFLSLIIAVNLLIYFFFETLTTDGRHLFFHTLAAIPALSLQPEGLYRLVTAAFLHASWSHVLINMYILWTFGDNVNDVFYDHGEQKGPLMFISWYLLVCAISMMSHCLLAIGSGPIALIPLVGASGGVSAVLAAYWRLFPKAYLYQVIFFYPLKVPISIYLLFWAGANLFMGFSMGVASAVSWSAHLGGFAAGYLLLPYFLPFELDKLKEKEHLLS